MSRETVIKCDICGQPNAVELAVKVGREMDAAGGTDSVYENIDLCRVHEGVVLQMAVDSMTIDQRVAFMKVVQGRRQR